MKVNVGCNGLTMTELARICGGMLYCVGGELNRDLPFRSVCTDSREATEGTLFVALGGSVDIYSGDKKRAPAAFRRLGCEWIYRTLCDGRRIKRVPKLFVFAYNALKEGAVLRKSTEKTVK